MRTVPTPQRTTPRPATPRPTTLGAAVLGMAVLVAVLWGLEALDQLSGNRLDPYGIEPRRLDSLDHVFLAPWLHGGWSHLVSNTLPFFGLGVLVALDGWRRFAVTTLVVTVVSGAAVWFLAPVGTVTLGASGIVFGWLTYVLLRGFYARSAAQVAVGVVVFLVYGGLLWGVLPTEAGISWQAHLGGAVGGLLGARLRRRRQDDAAAP